MEASSVRKLFGQTEPCKFLPDQLRMRIFLHAAALSDFVDFSACVSAWSHGTTGHTFLIYKTSSLQNKSGCKCRVRAGTRCSWDCAIHTLVIAVILALYTTSGIQMFALCPSPFFLKCSWQLLTF